MRYVVLLRGVNVGGNRKVEMKRLKTMLERLGCHHVTTYLNSGNALFESGLEQEMLQQTIAEALQEEFGFQIAALIKSREEVQVIAQAIPDEWQNNQEQKTDVAYLFPEVDDEEILQKLQVNRQYMDLIYVKGAVIWHVQKKNYNKSQLNKLIGKQLYQEMTVRNVNTARFLASN